MAQISDLKQSILQKAFSGELTGAEPTKVIAFPASVPTISTTDLHAGILAIAFQRHLAQGRQSTLGHVKAEEIAHMVEATVGIDLGRNPVKDAAGPNDYPHLKKVESRAVKAGFFSVAQTASGAYAFNRKPGFDALVARTRDALRQDNDAVDAIIDLMLLMDTRQAEIFATVFAAWNNVLIDGEEATDEAIVREARENWHPDKLKIPRDRFFAAIDWMRTKNIVPQGKGKRVVSRAAR